MNEERVRQIVRNFPENGLKQVLTTAENVRDLLALAESKVLPRLDFSAMQVDPTTYVTAEYRHVTSDLVLNLPLLPSRREVVGLSGCATSKETGEGRVERPE
jgi:hypothetical protein